MGFRVSIYLILDLQPGEIHQLLKLHPNGEKEEFPDSAIAGAVTKSGAYLLYVNDREDFGDDLIRPISNSSKVIGCNINETTMFSSVAAHQNGEEIWSVFHDANQGLMHLEAAGDLPAEYVPIREQQLAMQEATDDEPDHLFDVPVELFVQLGGVRYDADLDSDEEQPWQTLVPIQRRQKRWWPFS